MEQAQRHAESKQESASSPSAATFQDAIRNASVDAAEMRKAAGEWLETRIDAAKIHVRRALVMAALGIVLLVAVLSAVVTTVAMLFNGIAAGIGSLLGNRLWLGQIATALAIVLTVFISVWFGKERRKIRRQMALIRKYEHGDRTEQYDGSARFHATSAPS